MDRLTTDKPKDNLENSLNLFYIKDHETWVRGGGPGPEYADVSLFDFIRGVVKTHIPDVELPEDNDNLSMMMSEWLFDDPGTAEGVIALLYTAAWAYAELRHRLAAYEDTGLEPEGIRTLQNCYAQRGKLLDEYPAGVTPAHIRDLLQAEQDGRLVVKPFKPGTHFILCGDPNRDISFTGDVLFEVKSPDGETEWWDTEELSILKSLRQAGDREEAEAALKGGDEG